MSIKNIETYYERMKSSIGDKTKIVDNIKKGKILEVGFGSGDLLKILDELGNEVYGVDISEESIRRGHELGLMNLELADASEIDSLYAENSFDTIIMCSMIHEVFSTQRNKFEDKPLYLANLEGAREVNKVLSKAYKLLKDGGKLIIRDGVKVPIYKEKELVTFTMNNDELFMLDDYLAFWANGDMGFNLTELSDGKNTVVSAGMNDAMEFLYTYTWGEDSMSREREERYGFLSLDSYKDFLNSIGFENVHGETYLQDGYIVNLKHLNFLNLSEVNNTLPDSNMILVGEK